MSGKFLLSLEDSFFHLTPIRSPEWVPSGDFIDLIKLSRNAYVNTTQFFVCEVNFHRDFNLNIFLCSEYTPGIAFSCFSWMQSRGGTLELFFFSAEFFLIELKFLIKQKLKFYTRKFTSSCPPLACSFRAFTYVATTILIRHTHFRSGIVARCTQEH